MNKQKVVVAVTGASGSIYARILLKKLQGLTSQIEEAGLVLTENAKTVSQFELGDQDFSLTGFSLFAANDFMAPFASGSAGYNVMIICPCSMGTLGRIASGMSNDLITRAADVMLKERKKLILVTRDTPLSLIHIRNMVAVTEAGGIICPASPSFYSRPSTVEELASTVVDRVLDLAGFDITSFRWGKS